MMKESIEKAFNDQINWELYSGYIYLAMAAYFADKGLSGFAQWMKNQSAEELFHAMKMYDYVNERGGRVVLGAVEAPQGEWDSPLAAFEEALAHEQGVTDRINKMMDLAMEERDHATISFLQWFVDEQVEEEDSVGEVVDKLKLIGDGAALYHLDKELGARVFTWPAPGAE
jgi:ferritin